MHPEDLAHPTLSPLQRRHAELLRAVERGFDKDHGWEELAVLSQQLGRHDEAEACARRVRNVTTRLALIARVKRERARAALLAPAAQHLAAPAASHAGPTQDGADAEPTLQEHVVDALQFLLHPHLRWHVALTALAFPLLVAIGGQLTADHSPLVLAAMTALPGTCVAVLVGALARQSLLTAADGNDEPPAVPGFRELLATGGTFLGDALLVGGLLLGPSIVAAMLAAPAVTTLVGLAFGAFVLPVAWVLRQMRGDLKALSPVTLLCAVRRAGHDYPLLAATVAAAFAPALLGGLALRHHAGWLQIAVLAPILVLPVFFVARLLGTWTEAQRQRLGSLLLPQGNGDDAADAATRPAPRAIEGRRPARATAKAAHAARTTASTAPTAPLASRR